MRRAKVKAIRNLVITGLGVAAVGVTAWNSPPVRAQQQKPPAQVVNLADVRRQAAACEDYARALEAATAGLKAGSLTVEAGEEVRRHKAVVDPLCARQDAPSAGRNVGTITERTNDIRSLLP